MVAIRILNADIIADGMLVLSDGRTFTLSDIPGKGFNQNRLKKIVKAVQAIIDMNARGTGIRLIADLEDIDPDKIHALAGDDAWFLARYGGRMFIDGAYVVSRSTLFDLTYENGELIPHMSVVR